jgi:adenine-specific DNA-methyltransferase
MVELIWNGKYDDHGKRVAPLRVRLPFQTVETVNESAQQRQMALDLFSAGRPPEWRNRLIWGDKKYVLPALLDEFAGQVNLIYIDPPFDTGADFAFQVTIEKERFVKEPSIIEQKAYRDTWGRGIDSYLQWFYETAALLQDLLADDGMLYVHLDWHVGHYAKAILDEVFGANNFRNEIVWQKIRTRKGQTTGFGNVHDTIFMYSRGEKFKFTPQYVPHSKKYIKSHYGNIDPETGKRYQLVSLTQAGAGPPRRFGDRVLTPPPGKHWVWSQERIDQAMEEGRIIFTGTGTPRIKRYFDEAPGSHVVDIWTDIYPVNAVALERTDYATQKPEALLERIITASSNEGDLVLDCFCGSGTTAAVAEKLGRRWIACDLGRFAIHTARKRLLSIAGVRPFVVQNLGKYERQAWQAAEFQGDLTGLQDLSGLIQKYRRFILELYHARPITGYAWLHGLKAGRMVHVGAVDAPVSPGDVQQIALEFRKATGSGPDAPSVSAVDVLGWDFAFELNEVARQQAAQANIALRFLRIPREVLEKKAVEQGDITFFELAALSVDVDKPVRSGRPDRFGVTIKLTDFVIPPDDVPSDVQAAITHWAQWIDYWAVDWDNKSDTFHNMWQTYRTRQDKSLQLQTTHQYPAPGEYRIMVKVIDILGNDTTKTLPVTVP